MQSDKNAERKGSKNSHQAIFPNCEWENNSSGSPVHCLLCRTLSLWPASHIETGCLLTEQPVKWVSVTLAQPVLCQLWGQREPGAPGNQPRLKNNSESNPQRTLDEFTAQKQGQQRQWWPGFPREPAPVSSAAELSSLCTDLQPRRGGRFGIGASCCKAWESFLEQTLRQLLLTSPVTCTIQETKSQHGRARACRLNVIWWKTIFETICMMYGEESRAHAEANPWFPCHLQPSHEGQPVVCTIFNTYLSLDHHLVRLFHSRREFVDKAARSGHTERINTVCLSTVWIIHDFWTESKQTAGASARHRRLLHISGNDRENFNELVMWWDINTISSNRIWRHAEFNTI